MADDDATRATAKAQPTENDKPKDGHVTDLAAEEPRKLVGFDRVFPLIGGHHQYQWLLLVITGLTGILAFHHMGYTFLGAVPNHWCKVDSLSGVEGRWTMEQIKNISIPRFQAPLTGELEYDQCSYYDLDYDFIQSEPSYEYAVASIDFSMTGTKPCTEWMYDTSIYESTAATQFNLVCGRKYLVATIQATYMGGVFVGCLLLGSLSDRILGRRGCVLVSVVLIILGGFGATIAPSYAFFVLFRFIIAIGVAGSFQNVFTILMEYCDASSRAAFGFMQWVPFSLCYMLMALYAYLIRDWRTLQFSFSASTLILISFFWILPESSRWLASKNREEEAIVILQRIAKMNKHPVPSREELSEILETCRDKTGERQDEARAKLPMIRRVLEEFKLICKNYANLVRTPELRKRSLILWLLFMTVTLVYYGISFASPSLSDDPFTIVFLGGLVEFPAYIGTIPLAQKWGRKPATASTFFVAGLACAAINFVPKHLVWLRVIFSMLGKLFITGAFAVVYLLGAELYPTSERATGVGAAALMGRVGSILAPYIALMKTVYADLPTIIFAVSALLSGGVALLLPETKDAEMLEHVDAVEEMGARTRSMSQLADGIKGVFRSSDRRKESVRSSMKLGEVDGDCKAAAAAVQKNQGQDQQQQQQQQQPV